MPATTAESRTRAAGAEGAVRLRAFGMELEPAFPIPGVAAAGPPGPQPPVRLELTSRAELLGAWSPTAPERISNRRMANGRAAVRIDADPDAGYLIRALGFGCFWISPAADLIRCAPVRSAAWRWQRYLIGQVLPLAAVLRGLEVFHASAVARDGGALAFIGMSTAGKTSVALNLVLRGAEFVTDDVLVVSPADDGGVLAHPGVGLASLRHEADALLPPGDRRRLGERLGRDSDATRVALHCAADASPLRHAFLLERRDRGPLAIERLSPVDPRLLLGGSFNFIIRTPERLTNQLDLCARIANRLAVHRAVIPPSVGPAQLAEAIEAYVDRAAP